MKLKTMVFIAVFTTPMTCSAASFDCSKATTNTELAICKNQHLSILDEMMTISYQQLIKEIFDKEKLKTAQLIFLAKNKKCNGDTECLKKSYISRILEIHTKTIDLGNHLEKRKWAVSANPCRGKTSQSIYQKNSETITLIFGCGDNNFGTLYDIAIGSAHKKQKLQYQGGLAIYFKGNNRLSIDTTSESPQIIYLSWGLNSKGKCDVGDIGCFDNIELHTIKSSFGYRTQHSNVFNDECIIDIEILNKKLQVTYRNGACETGVDNRFTLRQINGIYLPN
jgi:uncharacterized protein YecT (DUF1311 family)